MKHKLHLRYNFVASGQDEPMSLQIRGGRMHIKTSKRLSGVFENENRMKQTIKNLISANEKIQEEKSSLKEEKNRVFKGNQNGRLNI